VSPGAGVEADADLLAAAYRPVSREKKPTLDYWHEPLALGRPLPTLPLWMRGGFFLPIDLEATYERAFHNMRLARSLGANGA
jgi:hypothetical protein